jgi:transposase
MLLLLGELSYRSIAKQCRVSLGSITNIKKRIVRLMPNRRKMPSLQMIADALRDRKRCGGAAKRRKIGTCDSHTAFLRELLETHEARLQMSELCTLFERQFDVRVSTSTMHRFVDRQRVATAALLAMPAPNARSTTHRYDITAIRQLLRDMDVGKSDKELWDAVFVEGIDAVLRSVTTSSRRCDRLTSIQFDGGTVSLTMASSKGHHAVRRAKDSDGDGDIEVLWHEWSGEPNSAMFAWTKVQLFERVRQLYPAGSYMCGIVEAAARRDPQFGLALLRNVTSAHKASASEPHLGLGDVMYKELKASPLAPTDLRCGHQFPARALREGIVRVRTAGDLRKLLRCVIVAGDVGVETLCTFALCRIVPTSCEAWRLFAAFHDMLPLAHDVVEALLSQCQVYSMVHKVRGSKRGRSDLDRMSSAGAAAAAQLAESGLKTGGVRALNPADMEEHLRVYLATYEPLYADSVQRALDGARRLRVLGRQQRRARDVASLADAVALFRAYLLSLKGNVVLDNSDRQQLASDIMLPKTAFDERLIVFLGHQQTQQCVVGRAGCFFFFFLVVWSAIGSLL